MMDPLLKKALSAKTSLDHNEVAKDFRHRYKSRVKNLAKKHSNASDYIFDDLLHIGHEKFMNNLNTICKKSTESGFKLDAWVHKTLKNEIIDRFRSDESRRKNESEYATEIFSSKNKKEFDHAGFKSFLANSELPRRHVNVFILNIYDKIPKIAIALRFDVTPPTIDNWIKGVLRFIERNKAYIIEHYTSDIR